MTGKRPVSRTKGRPRTLLGTLQASKGKISKEQKKDVNSKLVPGGRDSRNESECHVESSSARSSGQRSRGVRLRKKKNSGGAGAKNRGRVGRGGHKGGYCGLPIEGKETSASPG